ncbi:DHA2 family efflux MFS transporter permease subunit [Caldibacillus lycopersici]|uniref:DHA2 family efflux MFS transporter permease subunit n=1 Tax=Perspicuibacillus lycopersici TaxID=1325689 RepID=A0AAE3IU95_9BACI|nr:DHA2 family efflux MFS transporter permease subunit [Perspicuibacillus lycopersici]MCU9614611.1 DHA2 family efflux MFS transporter permease subunit [Perspicuibacillus lycopersici]
MNKGLNVSSRPPYLIIAVLMVGAFISFLNNTLLNVALTSIMGDLHVETSTVQWLTTGFMLVSGVMIPTTAFLIQKYSVRRLFLVAMSLFTIGTIVGAIAHVFPILLAARMIQASGSAIMMPLLMNVMLVSFPIEKRGTAMGVFGLILMFAPAIGPTLSGWIVEHYNWRALFYLVAPIAFVILILGFILLKDKKEKVQMRLDFTSLIMSSLGFGGLLYGFSTAGGDDGWSNPIVYISLGIGAISLILFITRQSKMERPMLNFAVFKYPMFALASAITMVLNMAMFSGFLLIPIYAQAVLGISPMKTGLMLLPGAILNAGMSPITGRLFDKFGGRILAVTGLAIATGTTFVFSHLEMDTSYHYLMLLHAIRMFGMSMVMMPVSTNGLNQLPVHLYPHGTAMNNTLNQVSAAIGTATLITIMSIRQNTYTEDLIASAGANATPEMLKQLGLQGMLGGINDTFLVATFLLLAALVLAFFIKRARRAEDTNGANEKVTQKAVGNN